MTIKTIDCAECGASVPYGRLSCSACGALLASVTGGHRATVRIVDAGPGPAPIVAAAPAPAIKAARGVALAEVAVQAHVRARPRTSAKRRRAADAAAEATISTVETVPRQPAPEFAFEPVAEQVVKPLLEPLPEPVFAGLLAPAPAGQDGATPWAPLHAPDPVLVARPYQRHLATELDAPSGAATGRPGAYRPPTIAPSVTASMADAGVGAQAGGPASSPAAVSKPAVAAGGKPGTARSLAGGVDAATVVDIAGWFAIVGSAMSLLGFLLPWSVTVIGASGFGGYFNGWGLASPTHALVFVGLLAVLALGIVDTPVPHWLRSGVLGLVLGGLLIGLTWPYVVGPLGADVGVVVTALGGVALVIGGVVASWATRHAEPDPRV
ncbi:MAG: hypothetical protein QOE66_1947 [Chloroflexota bacterium]|jgi:hypothetical protein|nr:hypothetical protein [Chloroflexota bacterium]